ncbi:hypothetical protein MTR67_020506 [Solanum verrucosum]|uniref:Uncharacterized protein n=1 Tax=Solanum verrucosum TaxID=315347 RepID=A0AAF0QPP4_SOLVR|nr:hypothetical protein MTR67_020506 [Solanum verrucosum]
MKAKPRTRNPSESSDLKRMTSLLRNWNRRTFYCLRRDFVRKGRQTAEIDSIVLGSDVASSRAGEDETATEIAEKHRESSRRRLVAALMSIWIWREHAICFCDAAVKTAFGLDVWKRRRAVGIRDNGIGPELWVLLEIRRGLREWDGNY